MTGVGDIIWAARYANRRISSSILDLLFLLLSLILNDAQASNLLSRLPDWWYEELVAADRTWLDCPKLQLPDCRNSLENGSADVLRPGTSSFEINHRHELRWGLLLPLTSRTAQGEEDANEDSWSRLEVNLSCLLSSIPLQRRSVTSVFVAIDMQDPVFDNPTAFDRIRSLLDGISVKFIDRLPPMYQGQLCWIWALLAKHAVADGADFFVLLGDDVKLLDGSWQSDVENQFFQVAAATSLPFGCACIAIQDTNFPCFPTFPVIHKLHLEIFEDLFPNEFRNQHGDPFLFETYRRFGASRFAQSARLCNEVGGAGEARYNKEGGFVWRDAILTRAVEKLTSWLKLNAPQAQRIPCIDVVIPTYRCNVEILARLSQLDCTRRASVHTIIVVDKPETENLHQVCGLNSYSTNRTVRVDILPVNMGASAARNKGLQQSFGDHCILLDDDVVPEPGLIDAYLGAIDRYPNSLGYVGFTALPPPETLLQYAVIASNVCYFYGISNVLRFPPWGVTANICVRSRTNNSIWFSSIYPRTGGGEDVDFCIRLQMAGQERLVGVPSARVTHPFWNNPLQQICGWAAGDVLCLSRLSHRAFRALPNWAELALLCLLLHPWLSSAKFSLLAFFVEFFMLLPRYFVRSRTVRAYSPIFVAMLATVPSLSQDVVRLASKLSRGQLGEICCHFDWMNGTGQHPQEVQFNLTVKSITFALSCFALNNMWELRPLIVAILVLHFTLWSALQVKKEEKIKQRRVPSKRLQMALKPGKKAFVVLGHQRTGSNLLCGHLASHPSIAMHFELFNEKAIYSYENLRRKGKGTIRDKEALRERDRHPTTFLQKMLNRESESVVGFKLFPEHIRRGDRAFFERLLADPSILKVVLRRENCLAVCASAMRSALSGSYLRTNLDHLRVVIEPNEFEAFNTGYEGWYSYVRERIAGQRYVEISYEELTGNQQNALGRIYDLLEVTHSTTAPALDILPQTTRKVSEAVANFDQLKVSFASTPRARDFDEDEDL